ncbi:MAG TPA: NAD-dependent epimerase/dehydratase family protein [Candidatus Paceibacterota bacterium]
MDRKTIFISGVAGFLGSHLAERMLKMGHRIIGCDNLIGGYLDNVPAGVEFYSYDCCEREALVKIMRNVNIVFHCACTAYEGLSVFSPHLVTRNTYDITASILSASIANKVERFVFCSSMARYGNQDKLPFYEDMTPNPRDPYGIAKLAAEMLTKNLCETHGIEYVIAVPHNIIGPRQKYDDPFRNVASIMINLMLQGRQPIIYGDGEQKRCFSFIDDVIDPLEQLGFQKNLAGHIINVGPDEEFISINSLARNIAMLLDFDLRPIYMADRPQEVKLASCSADKARSLLGYKTKTSLNDGLEQMIRYIRDRKPKPFRYHIDLEIISDLTPKTWRNKLF